ncbi:uroporphyrinogen-III synthase [Carbonactinospora thermoautotrophica]|uniref:uroporphyrinogen-III synthase n=1 Tax=Carbonactinospora thermoautotrophica TaxID=1469144 RepID=UPI00099E7DDC|nr:uroporphyrinogen-III synthase [Carbonactinospora thermoautotrophica]
MDAEQDRYLIAAGGRRCGGVADLPEPLVGFTVGVTADRRREELVTLLRRRGARVIEAPTLRIVPLEDDTELRAATERCLAGPLHYVVATTGVGWRRWMQGADAWGLGERLRDACRRAVLVSRGPKAVGAVRSYGLREAWSPPSEASDELLAWLLEHDLAGRRVAIQEHGTPAHELADALREHGAEVIRVPVYSWAPPPDPRAVRRLVEGVVRRETHAVTFTSAPGVTALLDAAERMGLGEELLAAFRGDVRAICIGPVCARPLVAENVPTVWPDRGRLGSLVRTVVEDLIARGRYELQTAGETYLVQGDAVIAGDDTRWLSPPAAAVLRALLAGGGVTPGELLARLPAGVVAGEAGIREALARLRAALGPYAGLVSELPDGGCRLAADRIRSPERALAG